MSSVGNRDEDLEAIPRRTARPRRANDGAFMLFNPFERSSARIGPLQLACSVSMTRLFEIRCKLLGFVEEASTLGSKRNEHQKDDAS